MGHNIVSLYHERFDTRAALGGCLININGETHECVLRKDSSANFKSPTYTVTDKANGAELCTFRPYHLLNGPFFYSIEGASRCGGTATLIVPEHGMLKDDDEDDEDADAA